MIADQKSLSKTTTTGSYEEQGRGESETELNPIGITNPHYENEYVMGQVDPLRTNRVAPKSVIRSDSIRNKKEVVSNLSAAPADEAGLERGSSLHVYSLQVWKT